MRSALHITCILDEIIFINDAESYDLTNVFHIDGHRLHIALATKEIIGTVVV